MESESVYEYMNKVLKGQTYILTIESLTITLPAFWSKTSFPL